MARKKFDIPVMYQSPVIRKVKEANKITDPRKKDLTPTTLNFGPVSFLIPRHFGFCYGCLLYTSPSPRDRSLSRMPSSA